MLVRLQARAFRNLAPLEWEPAAGRHLLLGGNGAGKTSLLEAIYAVTTTRSFRTPRLAECVRHGEDGFRVVADVETAARVNLELAWGPAGRDRTVNGGTGSLAEHLAVQPVVAWTAEDLEIVSGPPARRRRFLDRGVVSRRPGALAVLGRYREALSQKRDLLAGGGATPAALAAWNRVLADAGAEVAAQRAAYAALLGETLVEVLAEIRMPHAAVRLQYRPSPREALAGAEELAARLDRSAAAERERRMPLLGPHRDELEITWGEHPAARVTSAGERKVLALALAAAHGQVIEKAGKSPLYLLDDLDAELAPDTLAAIWGAFADAPQLIASSNRAAVWEELGREARWRVADGRISPL